MQALINQTHGGNDAAHNRTDRGEKGYPTFSIALHNLYVKRRDFIKEKDARQTSSTSRVDMS
jgi:hypothetical protein